MGVEEKAANAKSLMETVQTVKSETEKEIREILLKLYKEHKFMVTEINVRVTRMTSGYEENPAPCYEIKIKLDL